MLIACVPSLSINDIFFLHLPQRRLLYPEAHLEHNEPCLFACLLDFFPLLIIVFLHQNRHLESDIANFKPCLSIHLLTSISEPQSARSSGANLGLAEKAKTQTEASIGAGGRWNQRRLHFKFVYLEQGMTNMSHVKGHRNLLHSLSLLLCWFVGTWEQLCQYFVPSTTLVFLQLYRLDNLMGLFQPW